MRLKDCIILCDGSLLSKIWRWIGAVVTGSNTVYVRPTWRWAKNIRGETN